MTRSVFEGGDTIHVVTLYNLAAGTTGLSGKTVREGWAG